MFKPPLNIIMFSMSGAGKTFLTLDMIEKREKLFTEKFVEIYYVYSIYNPRFEKIKNVKFLKDEIPNLPSDGQHRLLVCDDVILNNVILDKLMYIFMVAGNNKKITTCLLLQDIHMNRKMRSISLNAHVFIIFKHMRDSSSINSLFSQMYLPTAYLKKAYKLATEETRGYLVINLSTNINNLLRVSSNICDKNPRIFVETELQTPYKILFYE
jgi:hypothetical protein